MHEAMYYSISERGVACNLCPRECVILDGKSGFCKVRKNIDGKLYSLVYGKVVALNIDPIEKKPLYHFYPGEKIFSFGTVGCNLSCKHCQNYDISQVNENTDFGEDIDPERIVDLAIKSGCKMIAATYNEPTVFFEFMIDVFKIAKEKGLKTIVVSNGFISSEPLKELITYSDAFNIDLKGFDADFYPSITSAHIGPILSALKEIYASGKWLEITNLLIPTKNDDLEDIQMMCSWIKENLGDDVPLHFSAFFPMYKMKDVLPTSKKVLDQAYMIAVGLGLKYVYQGNLHGKGKEDTMCPSCSKIIIGRKGYHISAIKIKEGKCAFCNAKINGFF